MSEIFAFIIVYVTARTAGRLGRAHQPIELALHWIVIANFVVSRPIPAWAIYVATATPPAVIIAAALATAQSGLRPYFAPMFFAGVLISTLVAVLAERISAYGPCMAYFWLFCALVGVGALYRSDAPPPSRTVLLFLVGALPCEAVGWLCWGAGFDDGYGLSRMVTLISFLIVTGIQAMEGAPWKPRWATLRLQNGPLREWARTWRRADVREEATKVTPRN